MGTRGSRVERNTSEQDKKSMAGNWKYVKPDPKGLEDNSLIHPVREARPWHASFIIAMNPPPVSAGRGFIPRARRVNWGRRNGLLFDEN